MKILVSAGLANRTLQQFLLPISEVGEVDEILVVRNKMGEKLKKTSYSVVPKFAARNMILKTITKFAMLCSLTIKHKPDLIHGFILSPDSILCYIVGKLFNKKVGISLIAGPVELYIPFGSPPLKYNYMDELPHSTVINRIMLRILKRSDIVTTTGSFTKNFLIKKGINQDKIAIIDHLPHIVENQLKPLDVEKEFDLIFVGRLEKVKHVETIIKSVALISKEIPSIKLAIIGNGGEENKLQELSSKLNLEDKVLFLGYQSNIWNWLNKSKIAVITSEREGFPLVALEAMACGLPIITTKCGDIQDVIKENQNGAFISRYNASSELAKKVIHLLQDESQLQKMSANALATVTSITEKQVINTWERYLSSLAI